MNMFDTQQQKNFKDTNQLQASMFSEQKSEIFSPKNEKSSTHNLNENYFTNSKSCEQQANQDILTNKNVQQVNNDLINNASNSQQLTININTVNNHILNEDSLRRRSLLRRTVLIKKNQQMQLEGLQQSLKNLSPLGSKSKENRFSNFQKYSTQDNKLLSPRHGNEAAGGQNKSNVNNQQTSRFSLLYNNEEDNGQESYNSKKKAQIELILNNSNKNKKFSKAVRHMQDALYNRPPNNEMDLHNDNSFIFKAYYWYWHPYWKVWITLMTVLFIVQCFIEPQQPSIETSDSMYEQEEGLRNWIYTQESIIIISYILDCILTFKLQPDVTNNRNRSIWWKKFFSLQLPDKIPLAKLIITTLLLIDMISFISMYPHYGLRFARFLRPFWFCFLFRETKHTVIACVLCFRKVLDILLFFIIFVLFWGYMAMKLFSEYSYQNEFGSSMVNSTRSYDEYIYKQQENFTDYGMSCMAIYGLLSLDNYPDVFLEIIMHESYYYLVFFLPFVAINIFFMIHMPVAVIFQNYKEQRIQLLLKDRMLIQEALLTCFLCIEDQKTRMVGKESFFQLMNAVYSGKAYRDKVNDVFDILDLDADESIGQDDFKDTYDIIQNSPCLYNNSQLWWDKLREFCNNRLKFRKIAQSTYWFQFVLGVVIVNTALVIAYGFIDDEYTLDMMDNFDTFFNTVYILDVVVKIIGLGINDYFQDSWNRFDFCMVIITIITLVGLQYIYFLKQAKSGKLLKITKIQRVLRIFRSFRSMKVLAIFHYGADTIMRVKLLFNKILYCMPIVLKLFSAVALTMYIYALVGMIVFSSNTGSQELIQREEEFGSDFMWHKLVYTDFNSFSMALLSLFEICTQRGWVLMMYLYAEQFGKTTSALYFISFHMIIQLFLLSLLRGMLWDVFNIVDQSLNNQEHEDDHHHVNQHDQKEEEKGSNDKEIHEEEEIHIENNVINGPNAKQNKNKNINLTSSDPKITKQKMVMGNKKVQLHTINSENSNSSDSQKSVPKERIVDRAPRALSVLKNQMKLRNTERYETPSSDSIYSSDSDTMNENQKITALGNCLVLNNKSVSEENLEKGKASYRRFSAQVHLFQYNSTNNKGQSTQSCQRKSLQINANGRKSVGTESSSYSNVPSSKVLDKNQKIKKKKKRNNSNIQMDEIIELQKQLNKSLLDLFFEKKMTTLKENVSEEFKLSEVSYDPTVRKSYLFNECGNVRISEIIYKQIISVSIKTDMEQDSKQQQQNEKKKNKEKFLQQIKPDNQNSLMNKTFLKDINKQMLEAIEQNYLSHIYGNMYSKLQRDNLYPALSLQNNMLMILKRLLRYQSISNDFFVRNLLIFETLLSKQLMRKESFTKFVFQVNGHDWYYIAKDNKQIYYKKLEEGPWNAVNTVFKEDAQIYQGYDFFELDGDEYRGIMKKVKGSLQSMNNSIYEEQTMKTVEENLWILYVCKLTNNNPEYTKKLFKDKQKQFNLYQKKRKNSITVLSPLVNSDIAVTNVMIICLTIKQAKIKRKSGISPNNANKHENLGKQASLARSLNLNDSSQNIQPEEYEEHSSGDLDQLRNSKKKRNTTINPNEIDMEELVFSVNPAELNHNRQQSKNTSQIIQDIRWLHIPALLELIKDLRDICYLYKSNLFYKLSEAYILGPLSLPNQVNTFSSQGKKNSKKLTENCQSQKQFSDLDDTSNNTHILQVPRKLSITSN